MLQWILPSGLVFTDDWLAQLPVNAANSSSYLFVFLYSSFARSAAGGPCTACWGSGAALHGQAGTSIFLHLLVLFSRHRQGAYLSCRPIAGLELLVSFFACSRDGLASGDASSHYFGPILQESNKCFGAISQQ